MRSKFLLSLSLSLSLSLLLFSLLAVVSCSPVETVQPTVSQSASVSQNMGESCSISVSPTVQNGRLVFASEADFNVALTELNTDNIACWEAGRGFASYRAAFMATLSDDQVANNTFDYPISDAVLLGLLNPSGIIQVNPYIFKMDIPNRRVYALDIANISKIGLLAQDTPSDPAIHAFSFDDNVWDEMDIIYNRNNTCNSECLKTDRKREYPWDATWDTYASCAIEGVSTDAKVRGTLKYHNVGIYKRLNAEIEHKKSSGSNKTDLSFSYAYFFRDKCYSPYGASLSTTPVKFDNKNEHTLYRKTRCLIESSSGSAHYANVDFIWKDICSGQVKSFKLGLYF